jgi:alpha/beta superfamily hydrolase
MQRPVMDPTFLYNAPDKKKGAVKKLGLLWGILRGFCRFMFATPWGKHRSFRNEDGSKLQRLLRWVTYRMAFAPVLLVGFLVAIIIAATHPGRGGNGSDPLSFGVYYDPVNFLAEDGARLEGWLVPVIDAKRVLEEKELVVGKRYPAVVLVHDFASSRQQLLPLVQPLHEGGFVVLSVNLRGAGTLSGTAQTFGIREALDVKAAVEMLRRRSFVNPDKIALIGIGTGANACVIAGRNDPSIAAMVLASPIDNFDQAFASRVGQSHPWLSPLRNLFRWTFEVMYGVDTGELEMKNFSKVIAERRVLMTGDGQRLLDAKYVRGVEHFLAKHMGEAVAVAK